MGILLLTGFTELRVMEATRMKLEETLIFKEAEKCKNPTPPL